MEIFKDVPGYEGRYQVSDLGNVKSLIGNSKILRPGKMSGTHLGVRLSKGGIITTFYVHQLMMMAFKGYVPNGYESVIDHIDENPLNNRLHNFQILTNGQNTAKSRRLNSKRTLPECVYQIPSGRYYVRKNGKYHGSYDTIIEAENVLKLINKK